MSSWGVKIFNFELEKTFLRFSKKIFFHKKGLPSASEKKIELLDRKKETSPTSSNFENFDHDPQLDMKF